MIKTALPMLAVSRAGHDKGKLYVVLREDDGMCYLCDGSLKTLERPKRKKCAHLQKIMHMPDSVKEAIQSIQSNEDIQSVIAMYVKDPSDNQ